MRVGPAFVKIGKAALYSIDELDAWDKRNMVSCRASKRLIMTESDQAVTRYRPHSASPLGRKIFGKRFCINCLALATSHAQRPRRRSDAVASGDQITKRIIKTAKPELDKQWLTHDTFRL
jgi:hypothetical protein